MLECLARISTEQRTGLIGAGKSCVLAKLSPDLIITSSTEQAQKLKGEMELILGQAVLIFPALDSTPGEGFPPSRELTGERLSILKLWADKRRSIVIAPVKALLPKTSRRMESLKISAGQPADRDRIISQLVELGYKRQMIVGERGEFSVRGGILDIFPINSEYPARVELEGMIRSFDPQTQRSRQKLSSIEVLPLTEKAEESVFRSLPENALIVIDELVLVEQAAESFSKEVKQFGGEVLCIGYKDIPPALAVSSLLSDNEEPLFIPAPRILGRFEELPPGYEVQIVSKHPARVKELTALPVVQGEISGGFIYEPAKLMVLSDRELFGEEFKPKKSRTVRNEGVNEELLADLKISDLVVHENYGIGIYRGMQKLLELEGEHLLIEYARGDKLYVPLTMMGMVEKYSAGGDHSPRLSKLGGVEWGRAKAKVKSSVKDMTRELLELYAAREKLPGYAFNADPALDKDLEDSFPYEETPDQLNAIRAVFRDMGSSRPMDRLICGDVGYGKTEVAIRAAALAAASGKQTAVLVPTTILADQHYHNFKERFKAFPFKVELLSRFRTKEEQQQVVEGLKLGTVDVVIGTHRLLSKDILFKDLGLLIIDEEHRFGVAHKEKLKHLKRTVAVLTLTATPIPRTLYMSLSGARDLSTINTPPLDRSPVRTYVMPWSEAHVREAILREIDRGGQVYLVYNRVESIVGMAAKIKRIVPEARVEIGHGQMGENELEETMKRFMKHDFDVLVCSTIIESGLDIVNVNTILIDEADRFGLSQLYQLRGRVGRGPVKAYAYLFYHPEKVLTGTALDRLQAIQEFSALGSGYKLAMRDLEIRGSGNMLGAEQSGYIMAVGFDLYCELLEEAVREIKGITEPTSKQVEIDLDLPAYIPSDYVEDERQRIALYRRLTLLDQLTALNDLQDELADRFGELPQPLITLCSIIEIKLAAQKRGIRLIRRQGLKVRVDHFNASGQEFKFGGLEELKRRIEK
jgi:transcription-repair coupling factor